VSFAIKKGRKALVSSLPPILATIIIPVWLCAAWGDFRPKKDIEAIKHTIVAASVADPVVPVAHINTLVLQEH